MLNMRLKAPRLKQWLFATTILTTTQVLATTDVEVPVEIQKPEVIQGYIKDDLFIYMHVGSSKKFKILGSINASTPVTVMDSNDETGFIKIKDDRGRIGWIEKTTFTTEDSQAVKFAQLQTQYQELQAISEQDQNELDRLKQKLTQVNKKQQESQVKITKLQELQDNLQQQVALKQDEKELKKMIYGAAICVVGLILGLLLPMITPRKRRSDHWV